MHHHPLEEELTAQEEKLIGAYLDGECSFLGRMRVRHLLRSSEAARRCLLSMQTASRIVVEALRGGQEQPEKHRVELWDRVSLRLMQEERAEVFLGRRKATAEPSWRRAFAPLGWTAAGAAVSALVALLILSPGGSMRGRGYAAVEQSNPPSSFRPVSAVEGPDQENYLPQPLPRQMADARGTGNVFEVDWMKSRGSVRVIHDPQRQAIFWVNRSRPSYGERGERTEPILDITPLAREPIRMLEDDIPTAFSAYNR